MHIPWEDLQTVEALVRTGTIVAAAKELGLRHSSVSRRVDALERALEAPLFLRGPRLRPTTLATQIAARAALMATHAAQIDTLVEGERRSREQRLVVTTNDVLAPLLFAALARRPLGPRVQVQVTDTETSLAPGVTDLALRPGNQPEGSLRGWRLGRLRLGQYAAKPGLEAWVLPSPGLRARASMRWWKAVPADAPGHVECDSLLAMRDACVAGLGRAVLPSLLALHDPRLALEHRVEGGPPVWLLASATRRADPSLRALAEQLAAALRAARGAWE